MSFGIITGNRNMEENQNIYYMDTHSFIIYRKTRDTYRQILLKMFKQDLISQIINQTDHYPEKKDKKIISFMEGELGGKIITGFASFRSKIYSYLINDRDGNKKAKRTR